MSAARRVAAGRQETSHRAAVRERRSTRRRARRAFGSDRWVELGLLLLALAIGLSMYALVWHGVGKPGLPGNFTTIAALGVGVALVTHLVIRYLTPAADPTLVPAALALNGLGLAVIYRVDVATNAANARSQLILTAAGLVFFLLTLIFLRDPRRLQRYKWTSLVAGVVLLLLPLSPFGVEINGSRLWIRLAGFSFQPAEIAKICFAVFFAAYLTSERDNLSLAGPKVLGLRLPKLRHSLPIFVAWAVCLGVLVLEKDFGTALLFFGLFVVMLYISTHQLSWLIIGGLLTVVGMVLIVRVVPHIHARVAIWLDPFNQDLYNARGGSYQLVQGLFGMGYGGLLGTGPGKGHPELVYAAQSDFIIATIGEELGLIGLLAVLCIYLLMVSRGLRIALDARAHFTKLLASGLAFIIALQVFIVVGGVTRVIPLTGLALPFLAQGGSALLTNWIIIAILLRISHAARTVPEGVVLPTDAELAQLSLAQHSNDDAFPTRAVGTGDAEASGPGADVVERADHEENAAGQAEDAATDPNNGSETRVIEL